MTLDAVDTGAAALRSPRAASAVDLGAIAAPARLAAAARASATLVGYGLWAIGGITRFDVPGDPSYFVTRQAIARRARRRRAASSRSVDPADGLPAPLARRSTAARSA